MKIKTYTHLFSERILISREFFKNIGLSILDDYSNDKGFCIELNKKSYLMVLEKSHFLSFHPTLNLASLDVHSSFISLEMSSVKRVDQLIKKVIKFGGVETEQAHEDEWVYYRSFKDTDNHQFEVFYMKKK